MHREMSVMKFIQLTQAGMEKDRLTSAVVVNFDLIKSFFPNPNYTETILRFVDDSAISVQEDVELIRKLINQ
jgi:hypothetical protein